MGRSSELAERHGVEDNAFMCVYTIMRPSLQTAADGIEERQVRRRLMADSPSWIGTFLIIFQP